MNELWLCNNGVLYGGAKSSPSVSMGKAIEAQPEEMLLAAAFLTVVTVAVCSTGNCSQWGASYESKTWPGPTPSSVKMSRKCWRIRYISHKVFRTNLRWIPLYKSIGSFFYNLMIDKMISFWSIFKYEFASESTSNRQFSIIEQINLVAIGHEIATGRSHVSNYSRKFTPEEFFVWPPWKAHHFD